MIKKEIYICEICNQTYDKPEDAVNCEERGVPEFDESLLPVVYHYGSSDYDNMTFALACVSKKSHYIHGHSWATRNNCNGDNLDAYCQGRTSFTEKNKPIIGETFSRMINFLIFKFGIDEINCVNAEGNIVPLIQFLKEEDVLLGEVLRNEKNPI